MKLLRYGLFCSLFFLVWFLLAEKALAHKVNIFAYAENGLLYTEAYFPDGRPVESGAIEILDSHGTMLQVGTTDQEGKFSCPVPKQDDLTIVINASMGHRNTFILKKEEME